ncbi:MAG: DUF3108 domain-containing protein [Candidatus Acidiferrales bacterium]
MMPERKFRASSRASLASAALALALLLISAAGAAQSRHPGRGASPKPAAVVADPPAPFKVGELLNYRVGWSTFSSAATVELSVAERRDLYGWNTFHLRALAHTLNPVRSLFVIDDQFDSYSDAQNLASRQYEMYLHELGKTKTSVYHLTQPGAPPRGEGPSVIVLPGTLDPLGVLYAIREADWQRVPQLSALVFDGHEVYQMQAHREASGESVSVAAGNFSATRIAIRVFQNGEEVPDTDFRLWLAHDSARTPVLLEATLPFGTLRIELTSAHE